MTPLGLLIQMQTFTVACEDPACTVLTFTFHFLSSLFFPFSCLNFFPGHWVGFILVGKGFGKAFRILEWDERKDRRVVEQDFHGNFQVNLTCFFAFFSGILDWIEPILVWVWKISSLCTRERTKLSLTSKTDDVTSGRRNVDPHGCLRAVQEWMGLGKSYCSITPSLGTGHFQKGGR